MNNFLSSINLYQAIAVLLTIAVILHFMLNFGLRQIIKQTDKSINKLDDHLIAAIASPLKALLWFAWLYFCIYSLNNTPIKLVLTYIDIVPIFIITWAVIRMIGAVERFLLENNKNINQDSVSLLARLAKISVIIMITLGIAQFFGFSIASILTFGGVGGVVMGFAAKDMLANIFGGLMIQMDKPFSTGDWIRSEKFEGTVEKVGWRMTRIRTFSKNPVYIPNAIFSTLPIETPSRMTNRRIKEIIGIRYTDIKQLPEIMSEVENMLKTCDDIDKNQAIRVYFNHFNASSLDFYIHAFATTTNKGDYQ